MKWPVEELAQAVNGKILSQNQKGFDRVSIDSRQKETLKNSVFFALKGKQDGRLFCQQALEGGALAFVVERMQNLEPLKEKASFIQVPDTGEALKLFAAYFRKKLKKLRVAALTGSNGKTTAKHLTQILLEDEPFVKASPKSYNNHIGVPLSLLDLDESTTFLIQEIGASYPGEIKELGSIVKPDVTACTMVAPAHLEGFLNIENIAKEKEQIYSSSPGSIGVFNLDNPWTKKMKENFKGHALSFSSENHQADIFIQISKRGEDFLDIKGRIAGAEGQARIFLAGAHHLVSLMTAVGLALALGQDEKSLWEKLPSLKNPKGRSQFMTAGGHRIFFDAYNANPESMRAFLSHLSFFQPPPVLCLGDMLEMGERSPLFHQELGKKAGQGRFKKIFFIGSYRFDFEKGLKEAGCIGGFELWESYNKGQCQEIISAMKGAWGLALKASRALQFEKIVEDLKRGGKI